MNLVIDSGNTQAKTGLFDKGQLMATHHIKSFDQSFFDRLFAEYSIKKTIIASVSHQAESIRNFLSAYGVPVIMASPSLDFPFSIGYKTPQTLGIDRLAAVAGATELFPGENLLIIDAGTAITYEIVTEENIYLGGNIAPGMQMRFKALNQYTSKLPLCDPESWNGWMGTTTQEAIAAGVVQGMINEMEGYEGLMQQKFSNYKVIITGGDADFFAKKLKNPIFVNLNLVLSGLNRILEHNA
ncbi:MAG: type III pantothenate kinase [Breznakibacter sp.]|nr:type III pantothenate kinase [Breznakibacter sp.]